QEAESTPTPVETAPAVSETAESAPARETEPTPPTPVETAPAVSETAEAAPAVAEAPAEPTQTAAEPVPAPVQAPPASHARAATETAEDLGPTEIDFGAILEQFEQEQTVFHTGELVEGTVVGITDRGVL